MADETVKKTAQAFDLTKVHQANLKMLKEIDRICRKYKIAYMLDSGTLLGAVRHQGFIPWDDDVDVAFTRPNYEMFVKAAERELPEGMELLRPEKLRGGTVFYDFTARIIYLNSRIHEDTEQMRFYDGKLNHLWVDLFVLDKLPGKAAAASRAKFYQKVIYGMAMARRDRLDFSKYGFRDKLRVAALSAAGHLIPMRALYKLQRAAARKDHNIEARQWYYSNYQPDFLYVTLEADWCTETAELAFEDTVLMVPRGYKQVLKQIYGDYQTLPAAEKRVPAHSTIEIQVTD